MFCFGWKAFVVGRCRLGLRLLLVGRCRLDLRLLFVGRLKLFDVSAACFLPDLQVKQQREQLAALLQSEQERRSLVEKDNLTKDTELQV